MMLSILKISLSAFIMGLSLGYLLTKAFYSCSREEDKMKKEDGKINFEIKKNKEEIENE